MTITLKHIKARARQAASTSTSTSTPASTSASAGGGFDYPLSNLGDYFILILEILAGFLVFCWIATSNYLNAKFIDTDASYPIFGKNKVRDDDNNPYATRFTPGPIDMSKESEIDEKVGLRWWLERTQQSSYQPGGLILHKVFDVLKGFTDRIDESDKSSSTMATRIFTSILRTLFDIISLILFASFFGLVFGMWIPGWVGGLTAFLPLAYFTSSAFLQFFKNVFILFWSFVWMCIAGWVTVFPVIWQFFYLIYLVYVKQLRDDPGRFGAEFLKRMQSLVYIYVLIALIIAFASSELPIPTKVTVGVVSAIVIAIQFFMNTPKTE